MRTSSDRREYALVLALGAAGAGLILLAVRQVWAHAVYTPPHPLPAQDIAVRGQSLIPLAGALAIAGLACLAAVVATTDVLRRVVGALLSVIGIGAVVTATAAVTSAAVLSAASSASQAGLAGSTTSGTTGSAGAIVLSGAPGHAVMTGLFWHGAAVAGAVAVIAAGLVTAWRGNRWPVMSARYERAAAGEPGRSEPGRSEPGQSEPRRNAPAEPDQRAAMWDSLNRDIDPT